MTPRRAPLFLVALGVLVAMAMATIATNVRAHPAGFTSINRYLGVDCQADGRIRIAYLVDFAEMPSYAEIETLDADGDGRVSPEEQRAYLDRRIPPLVSSWTVEYDGLRATAHVTGSTLEVRDGERGLSTLRIAADVVVDSPAPLPPGTRDIHVYVRDRMFADHSGWREMAARDSDGAAVTTGFKESPSEALDYSNAGGRPPPRVDEAEFGFRLTSTAPSVRPAFRLGVPPVADPRLLRLSEAMKRASGSLFFSAMALGLAMALGTVHALSPGHGKALAAAYLAGHRARPRHALLFGATVAVAHTLVVFLVGGLALTIERTVGLDLVLHALEMVSAMTVVVLGVVQLSTHWRQATHDGAEHAHALAGGGERGWRAVVALGTSSGLAPCPSALAVLLAAMALRRYGFGLVLVSAFSFGVALTLTTVGLLVVVARRWVDRFSPMRALLPWLPVVSSACVLALGVVLCVSVVSSGSAAGP